MNIEQVRQGLKMIDDGMRLLGSGPMDYYCQRLTDCYKLLLTFAPHKIGDRVQLTETPEISSKERWGWEGGKHFLLKGAAAVVATIEADGDGFRYGLQFDADSWIDSHTKVVHPRPPKERDIYGFDGKWIERAHSNGGER